MTAPTYTPVTAGSRTITTPPPPTGRARGRPPYYRKTWKNHTYYNNDSTLNGANAPQDGTRLWTILDLSSIAGTSGTYQLTVGSSEYDYSGNTLGPIPILTSDLSGGLITVTAGGGGGGGGGGPGTLSAVPEPGSLAVMAAVIGGLSLRALRRRQQSLAA
ncbi:MAG: PEP-CTERM sorting domain-containing protein [Planctomyces sp.]